MKHALKKTWKILILVAVLTSAAFPFVSPPAEAIPACGKCTDGSFSNSTMRCSDAASNCSECTVCAK